MWDVTCVSTLARSHIQLSVQEPGAAAAQAEERKNDKYQDLQSSYHFTPLGFETMGHWGPTTLRFVGELGKLEMFRYQNFNRYLKLDVNRYLYLKFDVN